ncbi:MAG: helix-turn-helix transcriptional regulator [Bacillota bacterium]|nr:helix-turn-helix transcriptional regulator [Bacillota bacterium]MDW7677162.1 helix-turn-helix transcriptional regulator [Bacillota bacterium]
MEFNQKLQMLRKEKQLTQEELSEILFVSRTAISKWESGRGFPSIDSLKAISATFAVSIDDILSSEEIIRAAEEDKKDSGIRLRASLFGLMDMMNMMLFFLPLFGKDNGEWIENVSLLALRDLPAYVFYPYAGVIILAVILGGLQVLLQSQEYPFWIKYSGLLSIAVTMMAATIFIISQQPYIAFIMLWILVIKGALYIKKP